jgi:hypothetical protein
MQEEIVIKFSEEELLMLIEGIEYYLDESEIIDEKASQDWLRLNNRLIKLHKTMSDV